MHIGELTIGVDSDVLVDDSRRGLARAASA